MQATTFIAAGPPRPPARQLRLERAALRTPARPFHPALDGERGFLEALFTVSPAGARRLGLGGPEAWAVAEIAPAAPVVGLGWLAGELAGVSAAPGQAHEEVVRLLVDAVIASAQRRELRGLILRLSMAPGQRFPNPPATARRVVERDGALILYLDFTRTRGG